MGHAIVRHSAKTLGSGARTLVFGHGLGTDQRIWRLLAPLLAVDHRVVLLDWVGAGRADPLAFTAERYSKLQAHAEDLRELIHSLTNEPVTFVGHSAGGMIGVLAAIDEPKLFEHVVLLAASPRYLDDPPDYLGGSRREDVDALFQLMDENFLGWSRTFAAIAARNAELEEELDGIFRSNDQKHLREFTETILLSDFRAILPKLRTPALVLASARDDMVPVAVSRYLHSKLAGSAYECFDISGHCPQMTHPSLVEDAIRRYLTGPITP